MPKQTRLATRAKLSKTQHIHINRCESTVGDGTADSASKGESGVEGGTTELGSRGGSDLLDGGIDLRRAGRHCWAGHCECVCMCKAINRNKNINRLRGDSVLSRMRILGIRYVC